MEGGCERQHSARKSRGQEWATRSRSDDEVHSEEVQARKQRLGATYDEESEDESEGSSSRACTCANQHVFTPTPIHANTNSCQRVRLHMHVAVTVPQGCQAHQPTMVHAHGATVVGPT
jgi:hypothetical protein